MPAIRRGGAADLPAVDDERATCDIRGLIRGQKECGGGRLLDRAGPSQRDRAPDGRVHRSAEELGVALDRDRPGRQAIHQNPVRRQIDRHRAGEGQDAALGHDVDGGATLGGQ